jgi:hypothetical protein
MNVAHGQPSERSTRLGTSAARAIAPTNPPAKIAASSRRSSRGRAAPVPRPLAGRLLMI